MKKILTKENLIQFLLLNVGTLIVSFGIHFFKFPNNFSIGGVAGLALVLTKYVPQLSASNFVTILNLILLVIAFLIFGKGFGFKTTYATLLMSAALEVLDRVYPMTAPFTAQPLMELIFAVGFSAVGSAILFNIDASTGGTDIVAMILKKFTSMKVGNALLASDLIITILAGIAYGVDVGMFSILGLIINSTLVNTVMESFNQCKYFTIVTKDPKPIRDYIIQELNRSATEVDGKGSFARDDETLILTVVTRAQASHLRRFIRQNSPGTFMMITNTSEIIGNGFRG